MDSPKLELLWESEREQRRKRVVMLVCKTGDMDGPKLKKRIIKRIACHYKKTKCATKACSCFESKHKCDIWCGCNREQCTNMLEPSPSSSTSSSSSSSPFPEVSMIAPIQLPPTIIILPSDLLSMSTTATTTTPISAISTTDQYLIDDVDMLQGGENEDTNELDIENVVNDLETDEY